MKSAPQPVLSQDTALNAFFDAMLPAQAPLSEPDVVRALLFEVAGLTLALPLQAVKAVLPDAQVSQPAPDPDGGLIGTVTLGETSSRVVDTARLVLPARRAAQPAAGATPPTRCLIVLGDGHWSLACERTLEVVELERAGIKWRTAEGKRPWLAGMVAGRQCALLDVEGLCRLLTGQMA